MSLLWLIQGRENGYNQVRGILDPMQEMRGAGSEMSHATRGNKGME